MKLILQNCWTVACVRIKRFSHFFLMDMKMEGVAKRRKQCWQASVHPSVPAHAAKAEL